MQQSTIISYNSLMRLRQIISTVDIVLVVLAVVALTLFTAPIAFAANNQVQVVFSGAASGSFFGTPGLANFFISCALGSACSGSMSFPALDITKAVEGTATQASAIGAFLLHVQSKSDGGQSVNCILSNVPPPTRGPTNTVNVHCTSTPTSGVGSTNTANVIVTGT